MPADGDATLDPERIATIGFPTSFRGYDQHEVRRYLERLAEALRAEAAGTAPVVAEGAVADERVPALEARIAELEGTIESLRREVADRDAQLSESFDEERAAQWLGRETTRVLEAARRAASELTRKAATEAERVHAEVAALRAATEAELAEARAAASLERDRLLAGAEREAAAVVEAARAEAESLVGEAQRVLATRTAEADEAKAALVAEAERIRVEAEADAEAALEAAREQGRQMIAEARSVRERVLSDLVRRRRTSRQQLDQLKAGRDRMARALGEVRRQLDEALGELAVAVPEARQAAESVPRRDDDGSDAAEVADLERELDSARTMDLPRPGRRRSSAATPGAGASGVAAAATGAPPSGAAGAGPEGQAAAGEAGLVDVAGAGAPGAPAGEAGVVDVAGAGAPGAAAGEAGVVDVAGAGAPGAPAGEGDGGETAAGDAAGEGDAGSETARPATVDIDSLFARIRASRSRAVTQAREVLAGDGDAVGAAGRAATPGRKEAAPAGPGAPGREAAAPSGTPPPRGEAGRAPAPGGEEAAAPAGTPAPRGEEAPPAEDATPAEGVVPGPRPAGEVAAGDGVVEAVPAGDEPAEIEDDDDVAAATGPFAARDRALASLERDLARSLKRVMADAQSELLDLVGRGRGGLSVADLPPVEAQRARYRKAATRAVAAALRAGAAAGTGAVDEGRIAELVDALARQVADPIRARVEQTVDQVGGERDAVLSRVRAHYREFRTGELGSLVADTLAEAYAVGLYRSFPEGTPLVWTPDPRTAVGPDCFDNSLAGPVRVPEPYPTGHQHPPGAPGCRCLTLPGAD
jgi:DivIVA domain-containing protein